MGASIYRILGPIAIAALAVVMLVACNEPKGSSSPPQMPPQRSVGPDELLHARDQLVELIGITDGIEGVGLGSDHVFVLVSVPEDQAREIVESIVGSEIPVRIESGVNSDD